MSVKEIDNHKATKTNTTRDNAYKIHTNKYIEHDPSKPKGQISIRMRNIQAVSIEFSKRRKQ